MDVSAILNKLANVDGIQIQKHKVLSKSREILRLIQLKLSVNPLCIANQISWPCISLEVAFR